MAASPGAAGTAPRRGDQGHLIAISAVVGRSGRGGVGVALRRVTTQGTVHVVKQSGIDGAAVARLKAARPDGP